MLNEANMPTHFWSYTVLYANFVNNRIMTTTHGRIPFEVFKGQKSSVSNPQVIGLKAYVEKHSRSNVGPFDKRSNVGIFLGVTEDQCRFIAYDLELQREDIHRTGQDGWMQ